MRFQPVKEYIDCLTGLHVPWAQVLVIHRNCEIFRYGSGVVDLENATPIHTQQIINVYSLTKIITCLAALQLYDKKCFKLSEPLAAYLPEFEHMMVRHVLPDGSDEIRPALKSITVRDLFTMTAGFSYDLQSPSICNAIQQTSGKLPTRELAIALAQEPLFSEPGTRWQYSLCHDVLGALIQVISGQRLGQYIHENITDPLQMKDTAFVLCTQQQQRLAPLYELRDGQFVRNDVNGHRLGTSYESGGAGLYSTIDDFARVLNALTNHGISADGERILTAATVQLMRTDHLTDTTRPSFNWEHFAGYGYGLGVRTHLNPAMSGSLSPVGEFGWSGAAGAFALIDPQNQLTVMYTQHVTGGQIDHRPLKNIVYGCLQERLN